MDKLSELFVKLNKNGIPVPLITDPKTQMGSVSLTMLFISFNIVIIGVIGKYSKLLDVDITQAFNLLYFTGGLYFFRTIPAFNNGKVEMVNNEKKEGNEDVK